MNLLDRIFIPTSLFYNILKWLGVNHVTSLFLLVTGLSAICIYMCIKEEENDD